MQPADVRQFIAAQLEHRATTANARAVASGLRAYFRYRGTCGDDVHALTGVIALPVGIFIVAFALNVFLANTQKRV